MINFFRKKRKLLADDPSYAKASDGTKPIKYLKYAIGEIVLVVIGIVIALQINNWNEERKKQNLKNEYLISLENDYKKDTLQLNDRINQNKKRLKVLNQSFNKLENTTFTEQEEVISILKNKYVGLRVINTYNTNSFNLLISSGNIDLLGINFRESIMELSRLQVFEKEVTSGNRKYFSEFMLDYSLKYPAVFPNKSLNQILWKGIDTNELPKDLVAYFGQEKYTIERYIELSEDVLLQTKLVLKILENIKNQ